MPVYHALIRTHHITSRKKVARLKAAAKQLQCYALIRSGGIPGVMYVRGDQHKVQQWVDSVHELRYKDFQLAAPVSAITETGTQAESTKTGILEEVETVKEMAKKMEAIGIQHWWRTAMGFVHD
jgi:hypothetical protein